MITLEISKSKYMEWLKEQLEEVETLDEMDEISYHVPDLLLLRNMASMED